MVSVGPVMNGVQVTYRLIFTISPFLVLHYGTMDLGNDGKGMFNAPVNVRNNDICVYCKFSLEVDS